MTKAIRKYIPKRIMTKVAFHSILSFEKIESLNLLSHAKIQKLLELHSVLKLSVATFGTYPVVMAGALYKIKALWQVIKHLKWCLT